MKVLDHLAQAAAVILLVELLVVLIIFAAITGGLAFGLRWTRGKTGWAFGKANAYIPPAQRYVHTGTDLVAKPIIVANGFAGTVKGTAEAIKRRVRSVRFPARAAIVEAPVDEMSEVIPRAVDARAVEPIVPVVDQTPVISSAGSAPTSTS